MLFKKFKQLKTYISKGMSGIRLVIELGQSLESIRRGLNLIKARGISAFFGEVKNKIARANGSSESFLLHRDVSSDEVLNETSLLKKLSVRPFYVDPYFTLEDARKIEENVAIHVHLFYADGLDFIKLHLNNMPLEYDLFVSISEDMDEASVIDFFKNTLEKVKLIKVVKVQNRGRNISHLLITFKDELRKYEIVGHFHYKGSPHLVEQDRTTWMNQIFNSLLGDPESIQQVMEILGEQACFVYSNTSKLWGWDETGWSDNFKEASDFLHKKNLFDISSFKEIEFPRGFMFWARSESLEPLFSLDLKFEELPSEPIPADGTLLHALERLLLLLISRQDKFIYRLESTKYSDQLTGSQYEEQFDFSQIVKSNKPKILAYYLPQFHPIPENDLWHGVGFTEWNKVRAANQQFFGHHQQHVPHKDIGYYDLDSNEVLRSQAQMMKASGVHGMVFYHYWFQGKLVLEDVAKRLLEDPTIQMPFAFCWANENWTRRWDGNEDEILLKQEYSKADACDFINYLIPFFKDPRYITVKSRPVIFIYRTIATANWDEYLQIWEQECRLAGLGKPFVIATLTRGAQNASESGMDASVERVLFDWTNNGVSDLNPNLNFYEDFYGSVLDYSEVAKFYSTKNLGPLDSKGSPVFRSIVPNWDNTARYGNSAYILHNSSPKDFQKWLINIIEEEEKNRLENSVESFIVVNAWNEWAEGAHLEPENKHGYAYLNSVGRALSEISFDSSDHLQLPDNCIIKFTFSENASAGIKKENYLSRRFINSLSRSKILLQSIIFTEDIEIFELLRGKFNLTKNADYGYEYEMHIDDVFIFQPEDLDNLFKFSLRNPKYAICANIINQATLVYGSDRVVPWAKRGKLQLFPKGKIRGWKVSPSTRIFESQTSEINLNQQIKVNVIVRFHGLASVRLLFDCLKSLYSQNNVQITVQLCLQDVAEELYDELYQKIEDDFRDEHFEVKFKMFYSTEANPDIRSLMLNQSIKDVSEGYLVILDYDDILFPHALTTLADRLRRSRKAVTFGRIYSATIDSDEKVISRNIVYNWGKTYQDFLHKNISPIHGFMMDMGQIDTDKISYHGFQKYMEDYFLTLQIFTEENVDWDSLSKEIYIGDYNHRMSSESPNTLAILGSQERNDLLSDPQYLECESYINDLRMKLAKSNRLRP